MYKDDDIKAMGSQLKKIILIMVSVLVAFIIISIIIAKAVTNKVGMVVMILGVCLDVFILGMYFTPILAYYRYIKDLTTGRTRRIEGIVKDIGDRPTYKDNKLFFYEVVVEEDGIERVLLLDDQVDCPEIYSNKKYNFQIHENFIKDLEPIA